MVKECGILKIYDRSIIVMLYFKVKIFFQVQAHPYIIKPKKYQANQNIFTINVNYTLKIKSLFKSLGGPQGRLEF